MDEVIPGLGFWTIIRIEWIISSCIGIFVHWIVLSSIHMGSQFVIVIISFLSTEDEYTQSNN